MKTKTPTVARHISWPMLSVAVLLVAAGIYIWLPHRTQVIESHSVLQSGLKMDASITLESPWGWTAPSRIADMNVRINGKDVPVNKRAFHGLGPFSSGTNPIIGEKGGFPEIVLHGSPGNPLTEADWYFQNYSFSELRIVRNHLEEATYYADPHPVILASTAISISQSGIPLVEPTPTNNKSEPNKK